MAQKCKWIRPFLPLVELYVLGVVRDLTKVVTVEVDVFDE